MIEQYPQASPDNGHELFIVEESVMGDERIAECSRRCNDNAVKRIANARIVGRLEQNVRRIILDEKRTGFLPIAGKQLGKWQGQANAAIFAEAQNFFEYSDGDDNTCLPSFCLPKDTPGIPAQSLFFSCGKKDQGMGISHVEHRLRFARSV